MKRFIAILLTFALIVPMAIGGLVLPASASAPAAGKYVITGGGVAGSPDYALNTTTYTGAELGTVLASIEASDSGVTFNTDKTAESGEENFVVELIKIDENKYAIKLNNGNYLAAAGSTNLVSDKEYTNNEEAQWIIDMASDGTCSIHNVHSPEKYLGFSATAHYFRTFTSGGVAPVLYRFSKEGASATHEVSLQQSIQSSGTGSITATYDGSQYYYPEDATNTSIPTVFTVSDNARVTLYFEPSVYSALSKVRVNGIEKELTPSADGYSLVVSGIQGNTNITAVWVNGDIVNRGDVSTEVTAEYDNAKYDLEGVAYSDPLSIATVNTAEILEGSVFTDKSVQYNETNQSFTNTLSLNSVAYESATSESVVVPMDVVIVLDISGSMNTASGDSFRMTEVVKELNNLTSEIISSSPDNRIGLVTYSGATSTGNSPNNSAIDVPLAKHSSITLSYSNQNSGSTKSGSLSISADGRSTGTKTVIGGTYTQAGIARANEMFAGLSDEDKTVTINGQTYERTPILILVTDGLPTAANSNYTASQPGTSNYGNGSERANAAEGNAIFYTIRAAQHFRNQIKEMYNNNSRFRFYTVGVDMTPGTFNGVAPVVLNPTSENIAAMTSTGEPYNTLRTGLNSTEYRNEYFKDGKYVSYADASYDVNTGSDALKDAFKEILKEAQAVVSHVMPVIENSSVDFVDALGRDMELKSDPVLSYNGVTYAPTSVTQEGNKTVYHYSGTVQAYANGPTTNLSKAVVTKEKDANGIWIVHWNIPSELVPAYVYDEVSDSYIPSQTAMVSYDVAPTDAALDDVTSTRTFYSNYYADDSYHAHASYQLNPNSPFYNTYYGSLDPTLKVDKLDNNSKTDEYLGYITHKDGEITKKLGNNGALVVSAKRADITVQKLWKNPDGSPCEAPEGASISGQLWQKVDGKTDVMIDEVNLSAAENWQHTWNQLPLRDENHTYSYFGKETAVFGANAYDYYTVEEPDENGILRISNYYNRMTITINTDWYYNGVNETDGYENRTINTLYYKDSNGALVPVTSVQPIVFDSTGENPEDWNDLWKDLYIRHPDGTPIEYVVVQEIVNEDPRGDHTTFYTVEDNPREPECDSITGIVNPNPVVQIDNYLENPPIQVTVNKVWADNSGSNQDDITVSLYRTATFDGEGRLIKSATFGKAQNWTYTFEELAPGYYYYVRESKVSGYTASYSDPVSQAKDGSTPTITVTNTPYPTTGLAVEKIWKTSSGTEVLDASNMPSVRVKLWQIDHKVSNNFTVTVNFRGTYRYVWNRTGGQIHDTATAMKLNNIPAGADVTLNFTNFGNLRLYSNTDDVNVALTSGDATLNSDSFTHNTTTQTVNNRDRYYMNYGGSISLSDVRSNVVITISNGYVYNTSSTFSNQTANLSYNGGDTPVDETTEMLYQTVMLSGENDWFVNLDKLPTTSVDDNFTHNYSYYVEEQSSSYDPIYTNNDTENGFTSGTINVSNTIYPEILPDVAVFDFGLPMDVDVLDNDRKSLNINGVTLTGVSTTAPSGIELNTGVSTAKKFGNSCGGTYGTFSVLDNKVRYTPVTTNVPGVDTVYYEAYVPGVGYMYSKLEIAPATNVHFEESFLANNGYEIVDIADSRAQSDQNILYGNDAAYNAYEENSLGRCYGVTVNNPNTIPEATFTFTGTAFDIISRSTSDSGVMVVEAHENNANGKVVKRFITDNYLKEDSLYQLPVVHCTDLPYGTYYVTVRAYYNQIFDHNLTAINTPKQRSASNKDMSAVLKDLGWPADAEYEYSPAKAAAGNTQKQSAAPATRSITPAATGSYNVYIDGIRIYNPLDMSPTGVGGALYTTAKEMNPLYLQIRKMLLDANNWDSVGGGIVDAVMYIADKSSTDSPDEAFITDGIYLSTSGVLNTVTENGKTYILDKDSKRIQFNDQDVWTTGTGKDRKYYAGSTELTKQELNTLELSYYDNVFRARGPENEAYLTNGNGIAFAVEANTGVHISAKSPNGQPVTLCVYDGTNWVSVATISSATEMFYDITPYTRNSGNNVIIKCVADGDGILSLCQVKLIQGTAAKRSVRLNAAVAYAALKAMNGESAVVQKEHEHVWKVTDNTATCNEAGTITYTCSTCGETRTTYARAAGHSYALEVKPADACVSDGQMIFICTVCGESVARVLQRERHTYTQERVEAADGEPGYTLHTCNGCGFSYRVVDNPCAETGHIYTYEINDDGTHTAACTVCGQVDVQAHSFEDGVCDCGAVDGEDHGGDEDTHDCPCDNYSDLNKAAWYHEGVDFALNNGLMNGVGDGMFDPDGKLTRAMLVTILYRYENEPDVADATNPFADVPAGKWYTDAVIWAASMEIVNGTSETTFSPDATITREQIATILYRYAGKPDATGDLSTYPDEVAVSTYAVDAMRWAVGAKIINGMDGKLAPQSSATRAQIATILYRYLKED